MIMFLFSLVVGIVTLAMLLTGVAVDRSVCYPIRHPDNSTLVDLLDEYVARNLKDTDLQIDVKSTLILCNRNESLYNVLNLKTKFNVDTLHENFDVSKYLDEMRSMLQSLSLKNFTILSLPNEEILRKLKDFEPSIDFDKFQDEVSQK